MSEEIERLSPQEVVVLEGWAEGKLDKQFAVEMNLSVHTVRSYGTAIRSKLTVPTRAAATAALVRHQAEHPQTDQPT